MKNTILTEAFVFDLQLFADGAGAEGGAPAAGTAPSAEGQQAVINGSPAEQTAPVPVDLDAEFDEAIKGKYKEQYSKKVKSTVNDRLKGVHKELDSYKALATSIADKYGITDASDIGKLMQAIDEAEAPGLEQRAYENGVSVEVQKKIDRLEAVEKRYDREREAREREMEDQRKVARWAQEADALQGEFPGLDLAVELGNPAFVRLLDAGVDVRGAYITTHYNELQSNAMTYTARQVEQGVVNKIRANASRPNENGTSPQSAIATHKDVRSMSLEEMDALAERARRGERITF